MSSLDDRGKELLPTEIEKYVNRINDWRLLFPAPDTRSREESLFMKPYKTWFNDVGRIKQQWETDLGLIARSLVAANDVNGGDFETGARAVIEGGLRLIHRQRREGDHHVGNAAIKRFFSRDP